MTISREDLHRGRVDFSDLEIEEEIEPIPPGETLKEFMIDFGLSQSEIAKATGIPRPRISQILRADRPISADIALRLSTYFGNEPQFWMNLQTAYDLRLAEMTEGPQIRTQVPPLQEPKAVAGKH